MKKVLLALLVLISAATAKAQTGNMGIGTLTPDTSALLDLSASNRGLRIPQIALQSSDDTSTIKLPATSLLVYNTNASLATANGSGTGYYYNGGTPTEAQWMRLATGAANAAKYVGTKGEAYTVALGEIEIRWNNSNWPQIRSTTGSSITIDVFSSEAWHNNGYAATALTGVNVGTSFVNLGSSSSANNELNTFYIKTQTGTTMYRASMLLFPNNTEMILVEKF